MENFLEQMMIKTFNLQDKLKRFKAGETIAIEDCTADEILALFKSVFGSHILGWKQETVGEARKRRLIELRKLTMATEPEQTKCKLFS